MKMDDPCSLNSATYAVASTGPEKINTDLNKDLNPDLCYSSALLY